MSKVTFYNVRVGYRGAKPPWTNSGYTDQYGQTVNWGQIPVYNSDGTPKTFLGPDKNMIPVMWEGTGSGKSKIFSMGKKQSITLDSVVHKDVIQALRNAPFCVSSKKDEDAVRVMATWLSEHEPEVIEAAQIDAIEKDLKLNDLFSVFTRMAINNDPNADLILGLAGYGFDKKNDSLAKRRIFLKEFVTNNPDKFISWFTEENEFSPTMVNQGILKTAVNKGTISIIGGDFFFNGQNLGTKLNEIPIKFGSVFSEISQLVKPDEEQNEE